mgnify:CR=1 FL=1
MRPGDRDRSGLNDKSLTDKVLILDYLSVIETLLQDQQMMALISNPEFIESFQKAQIAIRKAVE